MRNCPLCSRVMARDNSRYRLSRDHILKHCDGHRTFIYGDTRNIRVVCQACNRLLEQNGQCPAAVVCWLLMHPHAWKDPTPNATIGDVWRR